MWVIMQYNGTHTQTHTRNYTNTDNLIVGYIKIITVKHAHLKQIRKIYKAEYKMT